MGQCSGMTLGARLRVLVELGPRPNDTSVAQSSCAMYVGPTHLLKSTGDDRQPGGYLFRHRSRTSRRELSELWLS